MKRRNFLLGCLAGLTSLFLPKKSHAVEEYPYDPMRVQTGILMEPLYHGGKAMVQCPIRHPAYRDWIGSTFIVHAGKWVSTDYPWPKGQPVAFTSVEDRFVTIGW